MVDVSEKICLAARVDGLGERLRAMVNAMVLAGRLKAQFRFNWKVRPEDYPGFHAVGSVDEMFAAEFVAQYHLPEYEHRDYPDTPKTRLRLSKLRQLLADSPKGLTIPKTSFDMIVESGNLDLHTLHARAFRRIEFAPHIAGAIAQARRAPLPSRGVAVHLRSGDIIFGRYRYEGRWTRKVTTYPIARHLIGFLQAQGHSPVIFGQDMITCRLLAERTGAVLAADILPKFPDAASAALADMMLMSRCEQIYAGQSGFSILAAKIGGKPHKAAESLWNRRAIVDLIVNDPELDDPASPFPQLQRAYAYLNAAVEGAGVVPTAKVIQFLTKAEALDPGNAFHCVARAALQSQEGDLMGAESSLRTAVHHAQKAGQFDETTLFQVVRRAVVKTWEKRIDVQAYMRDISTYAAADRPYTACVAAIAAIIRRDTVAAASLIGFSLTSEPANPLFVGVAERVGVVPVPLVQEASPNFLRRFSLTLYETLRKFRA